MDTPKNTPRINLPETGQERIVVVGAGFAGLAMVRKLVKSNYQVILIDKHNFHQFQPLFYQVAMAGLEPSSIVFPLRKLFHNKKNIYIRMTEVERIDTRKCQLHTPLGFINYDYLVLATGATTNFFGNENIAKKAMPMKSVNEALALRNRILADYEASLVTTDYDARQGLIDIVIVGGGPTGVEVAGALAEMKKFVLPKDYPELNPEEIDIYLIQGGSSLLQGMSEVSANKAREFLEELGVKVMLNTRVTDFDGEYVHTKDGQKIQAQKVIWAAGIKGNIIEGIQEDCVVRGNRFKVNAQMQIAGQKRIFAIGDIASHTSEAYPYGHPQVAQVAIQQGRYLARYFKALAKNKPFTEGFEYNDKGSMATIGRNKAVVDLPRLKFQGAFAWLVWLVVHLFAILGTKNKLFVFVNWVWNYLFYDQGLRLILNAKRTDKQD